MSPELFKITVTKSVNFSVMEVLFLKQCPIVFNTTHNNYQKSGEA